MALLPFIDVGIKLIDKLIPDPAEKRAAQLELLKMEQEGELKELEIQMSAILAEAQSPDKWTSRIYIMLLASLPFSIFWAFNPEAAARMTMGFRLWLEAIPAELYTLFGVGFLGYVGGRSYEKVRGIK